MYQALESARIRNQVVACRDAGEARRLLTREGAVPTPALFILDIHLAARESGIDFLRWIRSQPPPLGTTPVMMLSGSEKPEDLESSQLLGAMWFLQKPVTQTQLLEAVRALGLAIVASSPAEAAIQVITRQD